MKISVIGAGNIGGTLGRKWAAKGHDVVFGVRDPNADKVRSFLAAAAHGTRADTILNAVMAADIVLFAIPGSAMPQTVSNLGTQLNEKIIIDATNNIGQTSMHQLDLLRQAAPDSSLFRAFANLGWENFADPVIGGSQVDLFYCGDSGDGQSVVDSLIADIGLRPICLGGVEQVEIVDTLTRLWFVLALGQRRGRHLALKLMED